MIKVAILDDYQNISMKYIESIKLKNKYEFKVFNEPFLNNDEIVSKLKDFEVLMIMRERTPITKTLISSLKNLKLIITTGMRNKSIDLEWTKKKNIDVISSLNIPL